MQHSATYSPLRYEHCNTLRHTATHCDTLQHTATHYTTLSPSLRIFCRVCVCIHTHVCLYRCIPSICLACVYVHIYVCINMFVSPYHIHIHSLLLMGCPVCVHTLHHIPYTSVLCGCTFYHACVYIYTHT